MKTRTMRIAAIAVVSAAAVALGGLRASARPHGGPDGGTCGGRGAMMLEKLERDVAGLGLEQKQLDAVYQVIDGARRERRPLDAQVRAAHDRMRELLDQDQPDVDAVTAQADTIGGLMTQIRKIDLRTAVQVRSMLTPEQRKQLGTMHPRFAHGERRPHQAPESSEL